MSTENKIIDMYGGTVRVKYVDGNHSYWVADLKKGEKFRRVSGVTTYNGIKDKSTPLKYWVAKITIKFLVGILGERSITKFDLEKARGIHTERLQEASTAGTKVHDWIEHYTKGLRPPMPEEADVLNGVNAFLGWVQERDVHFVASETIIYSKKHDFCGQADFVCYFGNEWWKLYLGDYKTSNGLYNDVMLQTAPYAKTIEEMGIIETMEAQGIDKKWLSKAKKDGKKIKFAGRWAIRLEKRSPQDFQEEMDEKGLVNAEWQPFEAIPLDDDVYMIDQDFDAFLAFKKGFEWNKMSDKRMKLLKGEELKEWDK